MCETQERAGEYQHPSTEECDGDLSLPLGLALGSPIFPSGCEGKLGVALESLQGIDNCGCRRNICLDNAERTWSAVGHVLFHGVSHPRME